MIVKTAVNTNEPMSYAKAVAQDAKFTYFVCDCENSFRVLNQKHYSDEYLMCALCKRDRKRKPFPEERMIFRRISADARERGLDFNISVEWFASVCHLPCVYCGVVDSNLAAGFAYNGLDRQDNNLGYTEDNCLPCCFVCNRAKREMNTTDFMEWIERVYLNVKGGMR